VEVVVEYLEEDIEEDYGKNIVMGDQCAPEGSMGF